MGNELEKKVDGWEMEGFFCQGAMLGSEVGFPAPLVRYG
jgi:hypothetical protein